MEKTLLQCYNRGCGRKYEQDSNKEDSCQYHPGAPFFHDAYKGWSCCQKKCTDFTEFLNIKGCQKSFHSNEKPSEIQKDEINKELLEEAEKNEQIIRAPLNKSFMERPDFNSELTQVSTEVASSYKKQLEENPLVEDIKSQGDGIFDTLKIGITCKNGGCTTTYEGPNSDLNECVFHPGCPIFHEGLKFWSCCQKRTTDFNAFLNQVGCETGKHTWIKKESAAEKENVKCRCDWHQTSTHVIVSVFAKEYDPFKSFVKLNPIRLCIKLVFPKQSNKEYNMDCELQGIINVKESVVTMYPTKVEIKLKKSELKSWTKLYIEKEIKEEDKTEQIEDNNVDNEVIEDVDLSDL